ncbi:pentatricopeptide repeat-containing protein 2, mitochondrial-like [Toxorhynchites rutilus septentrionalis]|uniref:pentatricopeptide repeat-containing protein 2, mitochondrial-like n=1 Tax=Toxorhynchites rutilus septentrionalis TaxID=329112 RepID=UPI002478770D|nr:pentatricopeptide repeat-containing protein 2, mitochondrial-like [Toxorhynchites rutilus septentrionalis]XP_055624287.1 pentatricopeptide repeat-containing protein 2, mitochondrial-like [Toxorhynchites rutilus septentrionalis]
MLRKSLISLLRQADTVKALNGRGLYSAAALGMNGYEMVREKTKTQHMHNVDNFKRKMQQFVEGSATNMIFTEDLKNIIHLVEDTAEDKKLLLDMIDKYNSQAQELRFGNYVFGPVVMRALYYLKDPTLALKLFKDEKYNTFFGQLTSFQILGDLLYENGLYAEVREVFDIIKTRQLQSGNYPKHMLTLTFAACYKENSDESYQYAMNLWKELNAVAYVPMRKAAAFAAALALNHKQPGIALEILGSAKETNYVTIRQIKILALLSLERLDDLIPSFRAVLESGGPMEKKHSFCREVIQQVEDALKASKSDVPNDLPRILEFIESHGHVTDSSLDQLICQEVVTIAPKKENFSNLANSYRSRGGSQDMREFAPNRGHRVRSSRPGLADMN